MEEPVGAWIPYFDAQSREWLEIFSENLQEVRWLGEVSLGWLEAVLRPAQRLRRIDLQTDHQIFNLSKILGGDNAPATL